MATIFWKKIGKGSWINTGGDITSGLRRLSKSFLFTKTRSRTRIGETGIIQNKTQNTSGSNNTRVSLQDTTFITQQNFPM